MFFGFEKKKRLLHSNPVRNASIDASLMGHMAHLMRCLILITTYLNSEAVYFACGYLGRALVARIKTISN